MLDVVLVFQKAKYRVCNSQSGGLVRIQDISDLENGQPSVHMSMCRTFGNFENLTSAGIATSWVTW